MKRIQFETDTLPLLVLFPAGIGSLATSGASGIGIAQFLGLGVLAGGIGLWLWSVIELRLGGGSSAVPTGVLLESGPYGYSRNPMYVGIVVAILGEALLFESILGFVIALVVWLLFRQMVLRYEEPLLRKQLGEPFEEYCKRVPRWLPPFG